MKITCIARILPIALVLFAVLVGSAGATRPQSHAPYTPKHGKCRKGYHRIVLNPHNRKHKLVICYKNKTKKPPPTTPFTKSPRVKLFAHLSSGRQRDVLNPFKVTYGFSATAAKESAATAMFSEEIQPPSGVLALYSDGKLECAVNITDGQTASSCPVTYPALGQHTVTTIYTAGEESATATEVEQIDPLQPTLDFEVHYKDESHEPEYVGGSLEQVGVLNITANTQPEVGAAITLCSISCSPDLSFPIRPITHPLNGSMQLQVWQKLPSCELKLKDPESSWNSSWESESGINQRSLQAVITAPGYKTTEDKEPIQIEPSAGCPRS